MEFRSTCAIIEIPKIARMKYQDNLSLLQFFYQYVQTQPSLKTTGTAKAKPKEKAETKEKGDAKVVTKTKVES